MKGKFSFVFDVDRFCLFSHLFHFYFAFACVNRPLHIELSHNERFQVHAINCIEIAEDLCFLTKIVIRLLSDDMFSNCYSIYRFTDWFLWVAFEMAAS